MSSQPASIYQLWEMFVDIHKSVVFFSGDWQEKGQTVARR